MGKKKGGLCQRVPEIASEIVENFGCFLSYLIRSHHVVTGGGRQKQVQYEDKVMQVNNYLFRIFSSFLYFITKIIDINFCRQNRLFFEVN